MDTMETMTNWTDGIDPNIYSGSIPLAFAILEDKDSTLLIDFLLKWVLYFGTPLLTGLIWGAWNYGLRVVLLRRWYEKQGISFVKNCYAIVGAEMRVTELQEKNKSHDWLHTDRTGDIYGTLRGLTLQLYTTNSKLCSELIAKTGKEVDRNTPAKHSVGRLSPAALPFQSLHKLRFKDRKANLTRGVKDNRRLYDIVERSSHAAIEQFKIKDGDHLKIDIQGLMDHWTRDVSGEFVWGKTSIDRKLVVEEIDGVVRTVPFMTVLSKTFTEVRFYSSKFWNRVCSPLAGLPLTKEARRLNRNIAILRAECVEMMKNPEEGSVADLVKAMNIDSAINEELTLDDLITATFAGLDAVKSTIMGALYALMNPKNNYWREEIVKEIANLDSLPGYSLDMKLSTAPVLNAFICECMRYEPPGSLINNAAVKDFDLNYQGKTYKIKAGTRIVSSIHALHQHEESWQELVGGATDMSPLTEFDPSRFLKYGDKMTSSSCFMPFGKGPRRCPGSGSGQLMVKGFLKAFLQSSTNLRMVLPEGQTEDATHFHVFSKATYDIICDEKEE